MLINKKTDINRIDFIDYILIIGIVLAPMTGLRVWKIGPSEMIVLLWCLIHVKDYKFMDFKNYNFSFWFLFLYTIIIGTCYSLIFYDVGTIPSGILTYFYLSFISMGIYYGLNKKTKDEIAAILYKIASFGGIWYLFLYLYSEWVSKTFLGAPLWYATQRFSGGGTNPHQIAVFLSAIIFISYYFMKNCSIKSQKTYMLFNILISIFISFETKSSTLLAAISITLMTIIFVETIYQNKNKRSRVLVSLFIIPFVFSVFSLYYKNIFSKIFEWIKSDPNGLSRFDVFSTIVLPFSKSPLVGLGPGTHAHGGMMEFHNTYLEILSMGGILGLLIFIIYSFKIFNTIKRDYRLAFIILPLYIYGLAGFAMRRLVYWGILMIVIVLAEKTKPLNSDN